MSAAMEASIESIPSVGFSLLDYRFEADFTAAKFYVHKIVQSLLQTKMHKHLLLNVNIPSVPLNEMNGIKVSQAGLCKI